ncbi:MAG TPA: hypothetical protein P5572_07530 [Phycisphaerae bacterium]|nr:hypothetical protein [Phycisphaerales bacterium]HRX84852.1 hypothetical protein [Phycisphaerae bacterium]
MRQLWVCALMVAGLPAAAWSAELRLAWQGQSADARLIELAIGEQAVIEVHLDALAADDSVSGVFLANELATGIAQLALATDLAGWSVSSTAGSSLGAGGQQAVYSADLGAIMDGPGDLLVGTITIEAQSGSVGDEFDVAFDTAFTRVVDDLGGFYSLTATGAPTQDDPGRFHIGAGSPGYTVGSRTDDRDPLIVRIKEGSTGGGGTGGGSTGGGSTGGGDTGGGDTGGGDTGGGDTGGGDTGGNVDTNGTGGDTGGGNVDTNGTGGDTGGGDTGGNVDTNGGDTGGSTGGDTGGNTGGDNTGGDNGSSQGGGVCGFGMVQMMPVMLLGLAGMRGRRNAVRRL